MMISGCFGINVNWVYEKDLKKKRKKDLIFGCLGLIVNWVFEKEKKIDFFYFFFKLKRRGGGILYGSFGDGEW
ncbi:hypothetical protein Hanom_Chr16g01485941 [Helianthus anomalus]